MKKGLAILLAVMLLTCSWSSVLGAEERPLEWSTLDVGVEGGLQDFVYNGNVYIGYRGSEVYITRDTKDWEKVFTLRDENEKPVDVTDIFLVGDGTAFMLIDAAGLYYKSMDGLTWEKGPKEEKVKDASVLELRNGYFYYKKDAVEKTFSVTDLGSVEKVRMIDRMAVLFCKSGEDSSKRTVYYTEINGGSKNRIVVEGKELDLDVEPQLYENRMLLPFRAVVEALGGEVSWDEASQTVGAKKGEISITLTIDKLVAKVNGVDKKLDVPARIVNNRTLVPVRFVSESLGADVTWDYMLSKAVIGFEEEGEKEPPKGTQQGGGAAPQTPVVVTPAPVVVPPSPGVDKEVLKQQIIGKYTAQANALRNQGLSRISNIVSQAKSEYNSLPDSEKGIEAKGIIFSKYLIPATQVDMEIKASFNELMDQMRQELEENNLPTDAVQDAYNEFEAQRAEMISSLQSQM